MKWALIIAAAAPVVLATSAFAQSEPPAMQMPWPTTHPQTQAPDQDTEDSAVDHSQMDHGAMQDGGAVGIELPPAAPADHAAEFFYSAEDMAAARAQLRREHGGSIVSTVMIDTVELQFSDGATTFHWEGEGWIGGDINRFVLKTEGEAGEGDVESAEVQALYSRAIGPYFDLQAGVRYDVGTPPTDTKPNRRLPCCIVNHSTACTQTSVTPHTLNAVTHE